MYDYLRDVLNLADIVKDVDGVIETVDMCKFGDVNRISVKGIANGFPFALTLEVGEWKSE